MADKANMAVKLDRELKERLKALSAAKKRSPHWLMGEAIRIYVQREEEEERRLAEARAAADAYDRTGEYLADEDVEKWLSTWGKPREKRPPKRKRTGA